MSYVKFHKLLTCKITFLKVFFRLLYNICWPEYLLSYLSNFLVLADIIKTKSHMHFQNISNLITLLLYYYRMYLSICFILNPSWCSFFSRFYCALARKAALCFLLVLEFCPKMNNCMFSRGTPFSFFMKEIFFYQNMLFDGKFLQNIEGNTIKLKQF